MLLTDGRIDVLTDRQTEGQGESNIPHTKFVGRGYDNSNMYKRDLTEDVSFAEALGLPGEHGGDTMTMILLENLLG